MSKIIYSVTCLYLDESKFENNLWTYESQVRDRRWGFYNDFNTALKCVKENWTDIYENGYYNYVVITEEHEGITSHHNRKEWWFKVNIKDKQEDTYDVSFISKSFFQKSLSYGFQTELPK